MHWDGAHCFLLSAHTHVHFERSSTWRRSRALTHLSEIRYRITQNKRGVRKSQEIPGNPGNPGNPGKPRKSAENGVFRDFAISGKNGVFGVRFRDFRDPPGIRISGGGPRKPRFPLLSQPLSWEKFMSVCSPLFASFCLAFRTPPMLENRKK